MNDSLSRVADALTAVGGAWGDHELETLTDSEALAVNHALGALRRSVDAVHAQVAARIAHASRAELGAEGLAKINGYRNPTALIAATTGTTTGDAARLVAVGQATTPRSTFSGQSAPARHPHVASAIDSIGVSAAAAIIAMLDRVALRADRAALDAAERTLAAQATGLSLDQLAKLIARAEAHLDPDGLEPRERDLRGERSLHMYERGGMLHLTGKLDPETAAPVKIAIEALVSAELRNGALGGGQTSMPADADAPRPTVPQLQADALALLAGHAIGCSHSDLPLEGATVIVRVSLADLERGTGVATVDGMAQPVSVAAARRMAAGGGVIACVLGAESDILDWGREKRLFTKAQRLALVERDGGCAMCGLPPGMTKAHHVRWWARDAGPTDLGNGVLLCESCHHRIHDNGWEIRMEGAGSRASVWFIPPPHVDPRRTPRLGGRARFDFAA